MPTYQYVCTDCGQDLEAVQSFTDAALTECPNCSGRLRKRFGAVGVVFKGSGFYRNDSRSATNGKPASGSGEKKADKADKADSGSSGSSSSGSSSSGASSSGSGSGSDSSGSSSSGSGSSAAKASSGSSGSGSGGKSGGSSSSAA